jgi:FAD/FMN-containing dehydrogenase/Fe-S oxidoreductase
MSGPGTFVDASGITESVRIEIARNLKSVVRGEVLFEAGARALYASDSSNYRQVPLGVVCPIDQADVVATLEVARRHNAPVLARGAGTSLAGQACNVAVILDTSRHMNQILDVDVASRTARVQPGVVLDSLRSALAPLGLTFGPDPATHAWCTLGGMVGNNSCGTHALWAGKTVDNVKSLRAVTYDGVELDLGVLDESTLRDRCLEPGRSGEIFQGLRDLVDGSAELFRGGFPHLSRRVSGYNLDQLLPEKDTNVARALVGSESTCVRVTEITVSLMDALAERRLVVFGFEDVFIAADHVPELLGLGLIGLEGFDDVLVRQMRSAGLFVENLDLLPSGGGWLLCEVGAERAGDADELARVVVEHCPDGASAVLYSSAQDQHRVWQIRESALGATAHPPGESVNYEGWEDAAVPPEQLGTYLRGIQVLWGEFGYAGAWYGHFGQGCVHTRNNFDLSSLEGLATYRRYVERAAAFCVSLGGSISGEHGDGQSRGELLEMMYGTEMMVAFRKFKSVWDPANRMNPGKLIDAFPLDTNLRHGPEHRTSQMSPVHFSFAKDQGSMQKAVERCVGVGRCRQEHANTMCPSYRATRDEQHSTRGRARLFAEMFQGDVTPETWRNRDVYEALDLCLSCKACASECPTQVDMATYKAEFLSHYYEGRLRPRGTYALGFVAQSGRLASKIPRVANSVLQNRVTGAAVKRLAGITTRRNAPLFASKTLRRSAAGRRLIEVAAPTVVLWPDTFTDQYLPERGLATIAVLEGVGERVVMPRQWGCCGRPLYDSGMLKQAKSALLNVLDILEPSLDAGLSIVVPEPSCLATFRDELPKLLGHDPRAIALARSARSLSEHLDAIGWAPSNLASKGKVALHPHCHQLATSGAASDQRVLERAGYDVEVINVGCCGLAGSFGFSSEHEEISRDIGNDRFAPMLKTCTLNSTIVLDGFSCVTQAKELGAPSGHSVAQLLAHDLFSSLGSFEL